ncbi:hypothetical protein Pmani_032805 [Petrolisthes manimaculis]|uniref:Exonuclease domain-containing protein n=1 Tax=Petrolisthes manimaculis TaxID=1843537 RepID=A0AAE1TTE3_9EUCA|nr:hypothetical protein Pmani_032805 [Petrolisthes manimaculis]
MKGRENKRKVNKQIRKPLEYKKKERLENKKKKLKALINLQDGSNEDKEIKNKKGNSKRKENDQGKDPQNVKRKLTADEYAELKRRKKEVDKQKMAWPRIFLNCLGESSSLSVESSQNTPLYMNDIHQALISSISQRQTPPRWIRIVRATKISHVVTVLVEGVSLADILETSQLSPDQHTDTSASSQVTASLENGNADVTMEEVCDSTDIMNNTQSDNKRTQGENHGRQLKWLSDVLPRTSRSTNIKVEVMAPAKYKVAPIEELINLPIPKVDKNRNIQLDVNFLDGAAKSDVTVQEYNTVFPVTTDTRENNKLPESDKFDRRKLLLSMKELCFYNFPLAVSGCVGCNDVQFQYTSDSYSEVTQSSPLFSVDCEMCMTDNLELELTSISIVNEELELVYSTLVKPHNPIIDYLTRYSGITENMLVDVTTRLCDVQECLRKILPPDAILIGHSLDADLKAMKMMHPYVVDTSLSYNLSHTRKIRSSLKNLAIHFLGEIIQDDIGGHNPTEDAAAAMKLVKLKLQNDITFGDVVMGFGKTGWTPVEASKDDDKIGEECEVHNSQVETENCSAGNHYATNIFQKAKELNMCLLTTPLCMKSYDRERVNMKELHVEVLPGHKQVSKRTTEVAIHTDFTLVHMKMDQKLDASQSIEERHRHLRKLDKRLGRIIKAAASKSLLMFVFSGSTSNIPEDKLSNGFAMIGIKGYPYKT